MPPGPDPLSLLAYCRRKSLLYTGAWRGIDVVWGDDNSRLKDSFIVRPGASPTDVLTAISGAKSLYVDSSGNLQIGLANGQTITDAAPTIYQVIDGVKTPVYGHYLLEGNSEVGFFVPAYNNSSDLIIDPTYSVTGPTYTVADSVSFDASDPSKPGLAYTITGSPPPGVTGYWDGTFSGTISLGASAAPNSPYSIHMDGVDAGLPTVHYTSDFDFTVNKASTTTTLTSSTGGGTVAYTTSITFTASVSGGSVGTPSNGDEVDFYDGATEIGTSYLSSGAAIFTTSTLALGTHSSTSPRNFNAR